MTYKKENPRGCVTEKNTSNTHCSSCKCSKLEVTNWLKDLPESSTYPDIVEVRFKNTRKEFYKNVNKLKLEEGDIVAVEGSPGHDIGTVSLTGELILKQMLKQKVAQSFEFKKVYRTAKEFDIQKWQESIDNEHRVMLESRKMARDLKLKMKISDVEFQGDGSKAIFYYIADERVDFRELIRVLADEFKIRVEMRQIGSRQEAGRVGGIGPCGRELCCSSWLSSFKSVSTTAARHQELSLNPTKLAGQCGKLKWCLNFEVDSYIDAKKAFPPKVALTVKGGKAIYLKSDIHKGMMWYSVKINDIVTFTGLPIARVKEIIELNKKDIFPDKLKEEEYVDSTTPSGYQNVLGNDSLTRFDDKKKQSRRKKRKSSNRSSRNRSASIKRNPKTSNKKKNDNKKN